MVESKQLKNCLLVIDVQNDFVTGTLGSKFAKSVIPQISKRIKEYISADKPIFVTLDTHTNSYSETQEGLEIPQHCIENTDGWKLVKELNELNDYKNAKFIQKDNFGSEKLPFIIDETLDSGVKNKRLNPSKSIEILGLDTDCCVIANAIIVRTFCTNFKVFINSKCCAGTNLENHRTALKLMKAYQMRII